MNDKLRNEAKKLLLDVFHKKNIYNGTFTESKRDLAAAVIDSVLIAFKVRDGGVFAVRKRDTDIVTRFRNIGIDYLLLKSNVDRWYPFFVYRSGDNKTKQIALDYKACFGATKEWSKEKLKPCRDADKARGNSWKRAGVAFGYAHPSHEDINGALSFEFCRHLLWPDSKIIPQSVNLSDPNLLTYAMKRCAKAQKILKILLEQSISDYSDCKILQMI